MQHKRENNENFNDQLDDVSNDRNSEDNKYYEEFSGSNSEVQSDYIDIEDNFISNEKENILNLNNNLQDKLYNIKENNFNEKTIKKRFRSFK